MNITVHLALLVAVCLCVAEAAPDGRYARKQQRPTRGFKNVEMMTARGFGKRARAERDVEQQAPSERSNRGTPTFKSPSVGIARDFGKRSPELDSEGIIENLFSVPLTGLDQELSKLYNEYRAASKKTICNCFRTFQRDEPPRRKFHINGPLMVAKDFGKRSGNDDYNEEDEVIRVIRGAFKPKSNILIARGYGKRQEEPRGEEETRVTRGTFNPHSNVLIARGFGKRQSEEEVYGLDNFWENLEAAQEKDGQDGSDDKTIESIPMDWFVNEMINNADFARSVVRKFIDLNQDGILSSEELLRNV